ncbi:MAG TPA: CDP-alcohol phosphatidyltransferase family protein [Xanthobacteraceae bacterium]|nr:CDP-alcohol phosphatidyltransferase family protein [Xanthobacteraceae bacterium]
MGNALAFGVHILTAAGAGLAFLALIFATLGAWGAMFVTLGIALLVDGIDGPLARRLRVSERLPRWSGDVLDLVVDFLTYVFVPAYAIAFGGLMPIALAVPCCVLIAVTGALYFADRNMKMSGNYFRGFPAVWNLVAFYLFVLTPPPLVTAAAIVVLAGLTFAPIPFLHPLRVRRWRWLTIAAMVLWGVLAIVTVWRGFMPGPWVVAALCLLAAYFVLGGLLRPSSGSRR